MMEYLFLDEKDYPVAIVQSTFCYLNVHFHIRKKKKEHVKTGVLYLAEEQIAFLADCKPTVTNYIKNKFIIT